MYPRSHGPAQGRSRVPTPLSSSPMFLPSAPELHPFPILLFFSSRAFYVTCFPDPATAAKWEILLEVGSSRSLVPPALHHLPPENRRPWGLHGARTPCLHARVSLVSYRSGRGSGLGSSDVVTS